MKGLDEGDPIVIHYVDAKGTVSARTVTPKSLVRKGEMVYLVAFCHDRKAERTFRMDRVKFDE
jgi:predicted DNA-binding transcriptional regulator YafY